MVIKGLQEGLSSSKKFRTMFLKLGGYAYIHLPTTIFQSSLESVKLREFGRWILLFGQPDDS